jgi:hypothetical protein
MSILVQDLDLEVKLDSFPVVEGGRVVRIETTMEHPVSSRRMLHTLIDEILNDRPTGEIRMSVSQGGVGFLIFAKKERI